MTHIDEEGRCYIMIPVYSEERDAEGYYDIIGWRREYVD